MSSNDHDELVSALAHGLEREGFSDVCADVEGFEAPAVLSWEGDEVGYVPDITASGERFHLIEVETAESVREGVTAEAWLLFAEAARQKDGRFIVAVPASAGAEARKRLRELDLSAPVWELRA